MIGLTCRHEIISCGASCSRTPWYRMITARKENQQPSMLDASAWDSNNSDGSLLGMDVAAHTQREEAAPQERTAKPSAQAEQPSEIFGISTGTCGGINLKVR